MQQLLFALKMSSSKSSSPVVEKHQQPTTNLSFSIDRILSDETKTIKTPACPNALALNAPPFEWLYYTRYQPPRLPRAQSNAPVKRTPGRLPRVPFSPQQLNALETAYKRSMYLSAEEANQLARRLDLSSIRVKIWFQNRRARDRREKRSSFAKDYQYPVLEEVCEHELQVFNNGSSTNQEKKES